MNATTGIEWTDATSNPVKYRDKATGQVVWACVKKSPGCAHCYAETLARRYSRGGPFTRAEMARAEPFLCEKECGQLLRSKKLAGKRMFLGDMTDIFGEWVSDDILNRLFSNVLERRTDVTFQILTKRADRMQSYLSWRWGEGRIPARNIWCGVSTEDQTRTDERIPLLLQTPAAVRFLSVEPQIGPVDLMRYYPIRPSPPHYWAEQHALRGWMCGRNRHGLGPGQPGHGIDWVITGGESGPGARPFDVDWARSIVRQCRAADVPVFVKQLGSRPALDPLDHGPNDSCILGIKDRKGGDPDEWPADLRVREFPGRQPAGV